MKKTFTRRVLSLLLALVLTLGLTATAWADFADDDSTVVLTVKTKIGSTETVKATYTSKALFDLAEEKQTANKSISYKYSGKAETVVTATDYVKISDLLFDAGVDPDDLSACAYISFETWETTDTGWTVKPYTKANIQKADLKTNFYYFETSTDISGTPAPAAILLGSSKTAYPYSSEKDLQLAIGAISGAKTPAGKAFPSGVATVIVHDIASDNTGSAASFNVKDFAKDNSVSIPKYLLEDKISTTANQPVEFKMDTNTTVKFDVTAVKAIAGKMSGSGDVTVSVKPDAASDLTANESAANKKVATSKSKVVTLELLQGTTNMFPAGTAATNGEATVKVPFTTMPTRNYKLYVYYLNPETGKAVCEGTATVENNVATFTVSHFSSYALVPVKVTSGGSASSSTSAVQTTAVTSAQTGDMGVMLYAGMAVVSLMGTGVMVGARKRKES